MSEFYLFDIGSRGKVAARWRKLAKEVHVVGFEPDQEECDRLNKAAEHTPFLSERHYPIALSSYSETRKFYIARSPALSGFYKPIKDTFEPFEGDPDRADILETINLPVKSLASFCTREDVRPDFLKIDTQGAEYDILRTFLLKEVLGIEVELQVLPLYEAKVLSLHNTKVTEYTTVQALLKRAGFGLWWIRPQYWTFRETKWRRLAWFDALYINLEKLDDPRMKIIYRAYEGEVSKYSWGHKEEGS